MMILKGFVAGSAVEAMQVSCVTFAVEMCGLPAAASRSFGDNLPQALQDSSNVFEFPVLEVLREA
jgi:hypothetical protein